MWIVEVMTAGRDFYHILETRGFVYQETKRDEFLEYINTKKLTAYIGFDATASSLHVGSLVQIMMLYWLEQTGNNPIVLMGGGTTRIGDPSGKNDARKLLDTDTILENIISIKRVFFAISYV